MRRSAGVGVVAGSVLVVAAGVAVAVPDGDQSLRPAPARFAYGHGQGGSGMGPMQGMGGMHGMWLRDEFDYLAGMVPHHQEAIAAAKQLERSGRRQMRELGAAIIATQTAEIAELKAWLAAWYPGRTPAVAYRPMMRDLTRLSGDALDAAFLRDMIPHHMAAVMTSQALLMRGLARHDDIEVFARTVRNAQHAEIIRMRQWLAEWFDTGPGRFGGPMGTHPGGMRAWSGSGSGACPASG